MKYPALLFTLLIFSSFAWSQTHPVTFEPLSLPGDQSFWNGSDGKGDFRSNGMIFRNYYDTTYKYWSGFAFSNVRDSITPGFENQYAAYTSGGINGTSTYAVGYDRAIMVNEKAQIITGAYIANSTYTALAMKNGDAFSKKFGGTTGNDKDYLRLLAIGFRNGLPADTTMIFLADYTSADTKDDYILADWKWFDLTPLGSTDSIMFTFESSDTGTFGINTPLYFCMDDINAASPEQMTTLPLTFESFSLDTVGFWNGSKNEGGFLLQNVYFENQYNMDWNSWSGWSASNHKDTLTADFGNAYSVISGKGYASSEKYMTFYDRGAIRLPYNEGISNTGKGLGMMVNNSAYAYLSMKNGDAFSKKFGGTSGKDKDYFKLTIKGMDKEGDIVGEIDFYLADFRFDDDQQDYIIREWTPVDLSALVLKKAIRLEFSLSSSDTGAFGMNTPAFFCMDQFLMEMPDVKTSKFNAPTIKVYPNPAHAQLSTGLHGPGSYEIIDLNGRVIHAEKTDKLDIVDISAIPTGLYIIKMSQGNQIYSAKFVKI